MAKKKGGKKGFEEIDDMYDMYTEMNTEYAEEEVEEEIEEAEVQQTLEIPELDEQKMIAKKLERLTMQRPVHKPKAEIKVEQEKEMETDYRSPICCILGHADTGKTKILDRIRETDVQLAEAGGITQQIGATYIPIKELTKKYKIVSDKLPGILVIDTPGHEAFSNLRSRGSSMCNIVVLVIDIMHGLELQTKESIELLRSRKTPFIIALNKIDRINGWKSKDTPFSVKSQSKAAKLEFKDRFEKIVLDLASIGLNSAIFMKNPNPKAYVNIVPTSAVTGEGISDMLSVLLDLVETNLLKKVKFEETVQCMVLESRSEEGKAATIDVILSNGILSVGDKIVVCTQNGAVETVIRHLLTPNPMKETRVKSKYKENKSVKAAIGVRLAAHKLEGVLAGSKLTVVKSEEETERIIEEADEQIRATIQNFISGDKKTTSGTIFDVVGEDGIHAQASTLGALEALISILKKANIPIRTVGVGSISKKDIIKVSTISERHPEYAVMLCFDVVPSQEMQVIGKEMKVKFLTAEIIYHLTEKYKKHMEEQWAQAEEQLKDKVIFPCILTIVPGCVFTKRSPLVLGVKVQQGILRVGTPLAVVRDGEITRIGQVTSILEDTKVNPKNDKIKAGGKASIKVEVSGNQPQIIVGRKLFETDQIVSRLTRESIDLLKESFKDALTKEDWLTVISLKSILGIH
ncbi:translation initiation factor 5B [Nematocida ausubeli]|uniref:Eukaryotic translation initiation factor 5B n=1 Tax=Nematocida ausubeli (strain ATCC PRA-371 / ERTm2) TaxID=1913371 RepID=H8ZC35_NEMA1|nr:translation initiation factor aIF-2 [Nematocida ausubeli]EHY65671.1 eukaryotic translation initiation factor 5B [Nematocida ausubeli]KAI5133967.1 translation initiation factor 5B [Nematocida ausubeli]KAI5135822.1 translation initiation factor 5B [Nematocida ausubeli]KAI5148763.1 translation initiation factor 5B [Nematocida ausubeli]KAI5162795.1 translation initiation factor 5B [Nematocida ausubeli]